MNDIMVTDDQIKAACKAYGLSPAGRIPIKGYETDLDLNNSEE